MRVSVYELVCCCVWGRRSLFLAVSISSGSLPPAGCGGQCDTGAAATDSLPWPGMVDALHPSFSVCAVSAYDCFHTPFVCFLFTTLLLNLEQFTETHYYLCPILFISVYV